MYCELCDKTFLATNRSHHLRTQKHQKNYPDGAMHLRERGTPKTKNNPDQTIKPKTIYVKNESKPKKRTNNVTCKELISQAKEYNLKGYTKWNKQQLITF